MYSYGILYTCILMFSVYTLFPKYMCRFGLHGKCVGKKEEKKRVVCV